MKQLKSIEKKKLYWEWCVLGLIGFIVFASHNYNDFFETMRHGMKFWDALFDGHPLEFYSYCGVGNGGIFCGSELNGSYMDARYDFTIYLIFAIWNFPLWLIEKLTGGNIQGSFAAILYAKSMLLVAIAITCKLIVSIVNEITSNRVEVQGIIMSYLSSAVLLASVLIIGQYDILGLIFILAGVLFYIRGDDKKFILCFMIANSMKYFALLFLLPLVCLKEKNIVKIFRDVVISMLLTFFWKGMFMIGGHGVAGFSGNNNLINVLTGYKLLGGVAVFWVAYFALLVYAYRTKQEVSKEYHTRQVIFIGFVTYILIYLLTPAYPYWVVLLVPFLTILIHTSGKDFKNNVIITSVFEVCLLIKHYTWYSQCYSRGNYTGMLMYYVFGSKSVGVPNLGEFLITIFNRFELFNIPSLLAAGFTAAGMALIYLNIPKENDDTITYVQQKGIMRWRLMVSCFVIIIPITYYIGVCYGVLPYFE